MQITTVTSQCKIPVQFLLRLLFMYSTAAVAIKSAQQELAPTLRIYIYFTSLSFIENNSLVTSSVHTFNEMRDVEDYRWKTRAILRVSRHRNDDLRGRAAAAAGRVLFAAASYPRERSFNWFACLIHNRAEFYCAASGRLYLSPRFSLSWPHVHDSRAGTWSTWKWTSRARISLLDAEKYRRALSKF